MKKKIVCGILSVVLVLASIPVCAEESSSDSSGDTYTFRGIPWYSTRTEVEEILFADGGREAGSLGNKHELYRMSGTDYKNVTSGADRVDDGGYMGWYRGVSVAGYDPSDIYACYIYPINPDGSINYSDDDAEFYFGWYSFDSGDFSDLRSIYDDLGTKLMSLYGEGAEASDDHKTTTTWYDSANDQIRLLINADENYVTLGYIVADADARLDEMQAALDAEAAAQEAIDREENADNVSGL